MNKLPKEALKNGTEEDSSSDDDDIPKESFNG